MKHKPGDVLGWAVKVIFPPTSTVAEPWYATAYGGDLSTEPRSAIRRRSCFILTRYQARIRMWAFRAAGTNCKLVKIKIRSVPK